MERQLATRLVIIEPHLSGHHASYVRRIIEGGTARGLEVQFICSEPADTHPELAAYVHLPGVTYAVVPLTSPLIPQSSALNPFRQVSYWRYFHAVATGLDVQRDFVVLPYADYAIYAIALLGSPFRGARWAGICMRPHFHQAALGIRGAEIGLKATLKRILYERAVRDRTLCRLFLIDETFLVSPSIHPNLLARCALLPDPVDTAEQSVDSGVARAQLGLESDDFVILVYGAISRRKGLETLFSALQRHQFATNTKVVLAGIQDASARDIIARIPREYPFLRDKVNSRDFYHNADQEALVFESADVVWLVYEGHLGMSGVLVLASAYSKPVVALDQGLIGWHVRRKSIGILLPPSPTSAQVSDALNTIRTDNGRRQQFEANASDAFANHTTRDFQARLFAHLDCGTDSTRADDPHRHAPDGAAVK